MSKRSKTAIVQLKLRLDEPLRAKLERSAKGRPPRGISLNAEIVNRLDGSFQWEPTIKELKRLTDTPEGLADLLRSQGFKKIPLDAEGSFIWAEPGVNTMRMSVSLDAVYKVSGPRMSIVFIDIRGKRSV